MKQHEEYFTSFIEDDEKFDDYVEKMSRDSEWGGQMELVIPVSYTHLTLPTSDLV